MSNVLTKKNIYSSKIPRKKCVKIGSVFVTPIDDSIVKKMEINETTTFFEQEITKDGILLRIKEIKL